MIVETDMGRFRLVWGLQWPSLLFECPGCDDWLPITADMLAGAISIDHAADGCKGGYHQTVDLRQARLSLTLGELQELRRG